MNLFGSEQMFETGPKMPAALDDDRATTGRIYAERSQIICRKALLALRNHDHPYSPEIQYGRATCVHRHAGNHTVLTDELSFGQPFNPRRHIQCLRKSTLLCRVQSQRQFGSFTSRKRRIGADSVRGTIAITAAERPPFMSQVPRPYIFPS